MFLRKWKTGQIAVGFLVAAFLVLSGVNVKGLMEGQEAIKKANAWSIRLQLALLTYNNRTGDCDGFFTNCFSLSIRFGSTEHNLTMSPGGLQVE
ncbi:MAG TPA: hypothetical protein VNL73_11315 [Verrucomicrobiae bacterium]|nr:hypothetical protein [Verrucomicrobiae bacterium]